MAMPGRSYSAGSQYRYGFNGKENDPSISEGAQDYGEREYDPARGQFISPDPITRRFPMLTPYQFASNRPIDGIDMDGLEWSLSTVRSQQIQKVKNADAIISYNTLTPFEKALGVGSPAPQNSNQSYIVADRRSDDQRRADQEDYQRESMRSSILANAAAADPTASAVAGGMVNTAGGMVKSVKDHAIGMYEGYQEGDWLKFSGHTLGLALDVAPFIPWKGAGWAGKIFESVGTRYLAEDYALTTKAYKGFQNANKVIMANNPTFDLFSVPQSTVVDVTTTTAKSMNIGGLYTKLQKLNDLVSPFQNRVLQVYLKEGQYSAEQISSLSKKLTDRIASKGYTNTTFNISTIK
jgi:RHS repeat-associated protein